MRHVQPFAFKAPFAKLENVTHNPNSITYSIVQAGNFGSMATSATLQLRPAERAPRRGILANRYVRSGRRLGAHPSRGDPLRVPATPTAQAGICGHRCPRLRLALHRRPPVPPRRGSAMPVGQDRIWKDEVVQSSLNRMTPMSIQLRGLRGIQASAAFGVLRSLAHSDLRRTEDAPC